MVADASSNAESITACVDLTIEGTRLAAEISVPTAPARLSELVPLFHSLADAVVGASIKSVESQGRSISCSNGCAACCRQLVALPEAEARRIRDLVEGLPEPRRSTIRARFAEAIRRLESSGLVERLRDFAALSNQEQNALGRDYFFEKIACPFLEQESCSIYHDRPFACREYFVTSAPELCNNPFDNLVAGLALPVQVWPLIVRMGQTASEAGSGPFTWIPLLLVLEWAEAHPDHSATRPAPEWVQEFFERLCRRSLPSPRCAGIMGSVGAAE
jgi:Fe-S-cluster containining protein